MITAEQRVWLSQIIDAAHKDDQPILRWCLVNSSSVHLDTDDFRGELEWVIFTFGEDPSRDFCWNPDDGWDGDPPILAILDALRALRAGIERIVAACLKEETKDLDRYIDGRNMAVTIADDLQRLLARKGLQ